MKKTLLTLLLLLSLGVVASAAEVTVTYDFSQNTYGMVNEQYLADGTVLTETPATITLNKKTGSNGFRLWNGALRFHKNSNSSMTIAAGGATITKIELTVTGAQFDLDSSSTGTWSNNTWTGSATSVKLNYTTTNNKDVNKIVITYLKEDGGETPTPVKPVITAKTDDKVYENGQTYEVAKGTQVLLTVDNYTTITASVGNELLDETDFTNGYTATINEDTEIIVDAYNGDLEMEHTYTFTVKQDVVGPATPSTSVVATYNFAECQYGVSPRGDSYYESAAATMNEKAVALKTVGGEFRFWQGTDAIDLRIKKSSKLTFSVPSDKYYITKITFKGKDMNLTPDCGEKESGSNGANTVWNATPNSKTQTVTFTQGSNVIAKFYTITVEYETTASGIVDLTHNGPIIKARVATFDYILHVNNHNEGDQYKVTLTFTPTASGETITVNNEDHTLVTPEAAAAPARAAATTTQHKGTVGTDKLTPNTQYRAHVTYAAVGNEANPTTVNLGTFTTRTTGIEDVTVEGTDAPAEYYNLQGVRVAQPEAGNIYIVRRGAKVTKELVK